MGWAVGGIFEYLMVIYENILLKFCWGNKIVGLLESSWCNFTEFNRIIKCGEYVNIKSCLKECENIVYLDALNIFTSFEQRKHVINGPYRRDIDYILKLGTKELTLDLPVSDV